jgi:ribose transport system permease protein
MIATSHALFVVTLGMLSIARSLAMVLSNNRWSRSGPDRSAPHARRRIHPGGVPFGRPSVPNSRSSSRWRSTGRAGGPWGRHVFAIGGNEAAATLTGVPVRLVKVSVYMLC